MGSGRRRLTVLTFSVLVLFWGSAFAAIKIGLDFAPPVLFAGVRALIGGLAMMPVALAWGGSPNLRRDWRVFLLLSLFNVVLFLGLQTFAIMHLPSGTAAVLIYLQPILTGLLAWPVLGEPLSLAKLIGLLLGFSGIAIVSSGGFSGDVSLAGVLYAITAALAWAAGTVYFKKVQERVSTFWSIALPFVAGGVFLTLLGLLMESFSDISWRGTFVASLLYAGLVGTGFAWALWLGLVRAGEASRVAAYVFFVPLLSVVIGALFLGEPLHASLLAGAALIVSGIYLVNRSPEKAGNF